MPIVQPQFRGFPGSSSSNILFYLQSWRRFVHSFLIHLLYFSYLRNGNVHKKDLSLEILILLISLLHWNWSIVDLWTHCLTYILFKNCHQRVLLLFLIINIVVEKGIKRKTLCVYANSLSVILDDKFEKALINKILM